jgi:general secretion pathway protein M
MPKLNREQAISVAAVVLLLLPCVYVVGLSLQARSDALREVLQRREALSTLEARLRSISSRPTAAAPPAAFLEAATQGLAGAQLQAYLAQLASTQNATLVSAGEDAAKHDDARDTIRLQVTLDMNLKGLRALLYQLESGTPYVFVDVLTIQPVSAGAGRSVEDPLLRTSLSLRAFWQRGSS